MSESAWAFLRKQEWSMGNGQCPECHAQGPSWLGFGGWGYEIGHKEGCGMAAALEAVGQKVVHKAKYDRKPDDGLAIFSPVDYESPQTQALVEQIRLAHPELFRPAPPTSETS